MCDTTKTFGPEHHNDFRPWAYNQKSSVAKKLLISKRKLEKQKLAAQTKRSNVTSFITSNKSRQKFELLIGKLIEKAHADPLHLKNNACQLIYKMMLHGATKKSSLGSNVTNFSGVPKNSSFCKFVHALKSKRQLSRLANKVIRWFNKLKQMEKILNIYQFTGRDSRMCLHHFMHLVASLESP